MEETKKEKKPAAPKKTASKKIAAPAAEQVAEAVPVAEVKMSEPTVAAHATERPQELILDMRFKVASAVEGELIWVSARTGYKVIWNEYGEWNYMTLQDLMDMRNGARSFFENNWITIEDPRVDEVLKYLAVDKFYHYVKSVDDVDGLILKTDPDELYAIVAKFPYNLKEVVVHRAYELNKNGSLDSAKVLKVIQRATGIEIEDED